MTAPARTRRTQAERSAAMREALLDAAVDCLVERGFSGTTTTEVTRRAGVSLGALLHHFPAKADLLATAVSHVMQRRQAEFRKAMADVPPGADRLSAAIDLLWHAFDSPTFRAWVELWVAARSDAELARAVRAVDEEFERTSLELFRELFPASEYPDGQFLELGLPFAFSVMQGAALRGLLRDPDPRPVELLKVVAAALVQPPHHSPEEDPT